MRTGTNTVTIEPLDYRALFVKFLAHVRNHEGITFVDHIDLDGRSNSWSSSALRFSADEIAELSRLDEESFVLWERADESGSP